MRNVVFLTIFTMLFGAKTLAAQQNPDSVYAASIHTAMVYPVGKPLEAPVVFLNARSPLQISFDDFNKQYEDYYYSIELVDSAWYSIAMNDFDYVRGFNQNKITNYTVSSVSYQQYIHYQFTFPNSNCSPKLSGNYILKVFKEGNPSDLIFTKRFYVVEDLASVVATIQEPFDGIITKTHQRLKLSVDVKNIPAFQTDQLRVCVVQNNRYNDAKVVTTSSFIRNTVLEFNNESDLLFPAGKEYRWLDLQSLKLKSDRIAEIDNKGNRAIVYVKPDYSRANLLYSNFNDLNGGFLIMNTESLQSESQNDYAQVIFTYVTKDHIPLIDQKLYLSGAFTNHILDNKAEMIFDPKQGVYQKTLLLKQGYYSYNYILRDRSEPNDMDDFNETEGNHWETENNYSIFVYYHPPGTIQDQLIGFYSVNSKQNW